jgi:TonB family protein
MMPIPSAHPTTGTTPRHFPTTAWTWCVASLVAATLLPAWAQTAASTEKAQERSQQQSDNVYRWIRYFADQQAKKVEPTKARPKAETPTLARKPEAKAPAEPNQTPIAADTAVVPPAAQSISVTPPPSPEPQTIAATAPAAPEPEMTAEVVAPLLPVFVVDPTIPRSMRDESINAKVRLSFTVQRDGSVVSPTILTGYNHRLNQSALQAIAKWRFEPTPTVRQAEIEFEFRQE